MTYNSAALEAAESLIPTDAVESSRRVDALDAEIMRGALAERFFPKLRLQQLLLEVTALYSFFSNRYWKFKALKDNQEVETYVGLKKNTLATGEKFVSASGEREAAYSVRELNYLVGFYQGNFTRCQEYINSTKKLLETLEKDEQVA